MKENNDITQQEIFVDTLKVLVLANEEKDILCDEELDNYYKTLVVLFGRACIMQQLKSNVHEELDNEMNKLNRLKAEIESLETSEDSTLYDKNKISKYKEIIMVLEEKYNIISSCDNNEFYEKVADKILIEDLKLITCTSSSIAEKMELLITHDINKLFNRTNSGDDRSRLLELSEFKIVHDLLVDKKVVEEFKKDLYKFFSREEMYFLHFCYSNSESVAYKRLYDILLTNMKRAIKYLNVIYNQKKNDKEFSIAHITEIYNDYKKNDYPYSKEFIKAYNYIVFLESYLEDLDCLKKDTKFEEKFNMIEKENEKLYSFFNSKIMSEKNNKQFDKKHFVESNYVYNNKENDYSFLNYNYLSKKKCVGATFDNINYAITLSSTIYKYKTKKELDEIIEKVSEEIDETCNRINHLNKDYYIESVKVKLSEVFRLEAFKEFVYPNQKSKVYFSPKKYRKLLLSKDFDNVFIHRDDSLLFNKYGVFMLDNNYIFDLLIDENSLFTRLDLFLFLEEVIGLYLNNNELLYNKDKSSILSNDTICLFFSKFTETFNREGDIFDIIKTYSDELINNGYIEGLNNTNYGNARDYSFTKSSYFDDILERKKNRIK